MNDKNDSLLEIATSLMKKKRKPQTLDSILEEVFQKKGISLDDANVVAQFEVDFMLSGVFIYCGEDKNGKQLWDLKERQPSSLLDKDGGYLEDIYADDEDVIKNELKDDFSYGDKNLDDFINDDGEVEETEEDDIQEELGLVAEDSEGEEVAADSLEDEEDMEFSLEDEEDEEDDIEAALKEYNSR